MKLFIIYDNRALNDFIPSHGFSCLIKINNFYLMFDTGWDGEILLHNLYKFNITIEKIKYLFLSHFHWDHIGGLTHLLQHVKPLIFIPKSFSEKFKNELKNKTNIMEISNSVELFPNFYSTGMLKNDDIFEQALVIKYNKNVIVITGCAHPGVDKILSASNKIAPPTHLIGGFHGFKHFDLLKPLTLIVPLHCTKYRSEIIQEFPNKSYKAGAGSILNI
jgi:7,8-dihydropterin-6-yl-methyl-4-(beta-D-ribofuranosyl)aminobenzene 5'-phosphate synthase